MSRPLSPDDGGRGAPARAWNVSALLMATGDALAARFGALIVRGELSAVTRAGSGHVYFTLKDATGAPGALRCAMFRRAASQVTAPIQEGVQVELRGRLGVYEARGELQMIVESLQRLGAGNLYEEFLKRRARLAAEGWFDEARKRPLPAFARSIGVVTSLSGAVLHDVIVTLRRRAPHVGVVVYPSLVQGADAPSALVEAIGCASRRAEVDVLIVCRGGGSLEDLWAFNDERVVRAIADCAVPVVSGVGHETDVTLADLAADRRAATPTAAAETVAPEREALLEALGERAQRMRRRVEHRLHDAAQQVDHLALRLVRPAQALARARMDLQSRQARWVAAFLARRRAHEQAVRDLAARWSRAGERALSRQRERLARQEDRLAALDPRRVLERGYAWLQDASGAPVTSAARLQVRASVEAVFVDGEAALRVEAVRLRDGPAGEPPTPGTAAS